MAPPAKKRLPGIHSGHEKAMYFSRSAANVCGQQQGIAAAFHRVAQYLRIGQLHRRITLFAAVIRAGERHPRAWHAGVRI